MAWEGVARIRGMSAWIHIVKSSCAHPGPGTRPVGEADRTVRLVCVHPSVRRRHRVTERYSSHVDSAAALCGVGRVPGAPAAGPEVCCGRQGAADALAG